MVVLNTRDLIEEGVLQEANRQFFHPLGLALVVTYHEKIPLEKQTARLSLIDSRNVPEGHLFDEQYMSENKEQFLEKARRVFNLHQQKAMVRKKLFGKTIQEIK